MAAVCGNGRTSAAMLLALRNIGADAMLVKDGMAAWSTARGAPAWRDPHYACQRASVCRAALCFRLISTQS